MQIKRHAQVQTVNSRSIPPPPSAAAPATMSRPSTFCTSSRASSSSSGATNAAAKASSLTVRFLERGPPQNIPRIGLGLAALGRPGYINLGHGGDLTTAGTSSSSSSSSSSSKDVKSMRQHCWQMLDEAWELGIRYFDAARSYGRAEEFLGGWLAARDIPPDAVVVGSKWGYTYTAGWQVDTNGAPHEVKEHTATNLVKQAAETQQLLGQHLDLYQIHSAGARASGVLQSQPVLEQLAELKASRGWRIGLSVSGVEQAEVIRQAASIQAADGSGPLFDCVQATWNLLEQSAGAALIEAKAAGMSVIVKEAMANGRLTPRNTDPAAADRLKLLCDTAQQLQTTPDALALACVLRQPFEPMVLSGAATVEQLRQNYAATEVAEVLRPEMLEQLQQALVQPSADYWDVRSSLAWN